jgi:hypothetical protein
MKGLIASILLGLTLSISTAVFADGNSTLRVVMVDTDDVAAYTAQLKKGRGLINKVAPNMKMRAWQATFAGDATGAVIVGIEHPGSLADFATAWEKIQADASVSKWLSGLSGLRAIVSDSLYSELPL